MYVVVCIGEWMVWLVYELFFCVVLCGFGDVDVG